MLQERVIDINDDHGRLVLDTFSDSSVLTKVARLDDCVDEIEDHNFALVLVDEDASGKPVVMKKYALVDPYHSFLSMVYFDHYGHQLPEQAQKTAAANIASALRNYGLEVPDDLAVTASQNEPGNPVVDIRGVSLPEEQEKTASTGSGLDDLVRAAHQFEEEHKSVSPEQRREFASHLTKTASAIGMTVPDSVQQYGGDSYGNMLVPSVRARYSYLPDGETSGVYEELLTKTSIADPNTFAEALAELDRSVGLDSLWDAEVVDPYLATFGKTAEWEKDKNKVLEYGTNEFVNTRDLKDLAANRQDFLRKHFDADFVKQFARNPVSVFKSLPDPQKMMIGRIANDEKDGR